MKLQTDKKRKSWCSREGVAVICAGNALAELRFFGDKKQHFAEKNSVNNQKSD